MADIQRYLQFSLQDVDGFTKNGVTYKALNGAKLTFYLISYPKISFPANVNDSVKQPAKIINTTDTYRDRLGASEYVGYERPTIDLEMLIPVTNVADYNDYFATTGSKYNTNSIIPLNFYVLWNLYMLNHRLYLKDIHPSFTTTYAHLDLPINILINNKDWFGHEIFPANGVPVVINKLNVDTVEVNYDENGHVYFIKASVGMVVD